MRKIWVVLLMACSATKAPVTDDFSDAKGDKFSSQVKVAGSLAYGESGSALYKSPAYEAFTFTGHAKDAVSVDVTSTTGDAVAWLLDADMNILAQNDDASDSTTNSHIDATLPGDGTYYIVFRDYYRKSHYFKAALAGTSTVRVVELSEDRCTDKNDFVPGGQNATPEEVALDAYCGEVILGRLAPKGTVVMFGSSRLADGTPEYQMARDFASAWTTAHGDLPIMTGGGTGIMEAGNRGAKDAGGVSLGFSTYFKAATDTLNTYVTDGYMFSDFAVRERALLNYAKVAVVFPGGVGTAWELFMSISQVQTHRLNKIPIVIVSKSMGDAAMVFMQWMVDHGTVSPDDLKLVTVVDSAADAVTAIEGMLTP
jgi:uncharacterized protein (TIGR00730 family)